MPARRVEHQAVFLNIPYDSKFTNLYLAYIAAVSAFGFIPRATLAIPGNRRLDRISELIETCAFSIHDLSRVELDRHPPCSTPRFNMPFELGLAVSWARQNPSHRWFVFESVDRRLQKSLSDLNGTDIYIHGRTVGGILREVGNAFLSPGPQPTVPQLWMVYRGLRRALGKIHKVTGTQSLFTARAFSELSLAAAVLAREYIIPIGKAGGTF
jgi:hypothetical protein